MNRWTLPIAIALVVGALVPTAHATEGPTPEERVVSILGELADRLQDVDTECDRVARVLVEWTDEHRDELPSLASQTQGRQLDPNRQRDLEQAVAPALETIFVASMTCSEHDPTMNALVVLDGLLTGGAK